MQNENLKPVTVEVSKIKPDIEGITKLIAIGSSGLYILGFLVVTSYLATKGIFDQSLVNSKYVMTGGLTAIVIGIYYYFVWRKIVYRVKIGIKWPVTIGSAFRIFLDTYYTVEFIIFCCFSATFVCSLFIPGSQFYPVMVVLAFAYLIEIIFLKFGVYEKYLKLAFVVTFAVNTTTVVLFSAYAFKHPPLFSLAMLFLTFSFAGSVIIASPSWTSVEDRTYSRLYLALCGLTAVIGFGVTVFPHIDPRFGGQKPVQVEVTLSSEAVDSMKRQVEDAQSKRYLIFESDAVVVIQLGESSKDSKVLRIEKKLVQGLATYPSIAVTSQEDIAKQIQDYFHLR